MSDLRRIITKYVNVETGNLVASDNSIPKDGNTITIFAGTQNVMRVHLRMNDGSTYFQPEAGSTWFFGIDDSYSTSHEDYVVTNTPDFNIAADWSDVSETGGKICFRIDASTTSLKTALGTSSQKTMVGELWCQPPGGHATLLCQMSIIVKNIVTDMGEESELVYTTSGTLSVDSVTGDLILRFADGSIAQRWSKT